MAKPIFLIGFPMAAELSALEQVRQTLNNQLHDYHVLVYKEAELNSMQFRVLNALDATDTEIDELIEKTSNFIKSLLEKENPIQNSDQKDETIL